MARKVDIACLCGCRRNLLPMALKHGDPYHSAACLRKHLRIETPDGAKSEKRSRKMTGHDTKHQARPYEHGRSPRGENWIRT